MQVTRERILNILKQRGEATVNELSDELELTTVTIRHHLDTLRTEGFIAAPFVRHRKAPGRPQHVYTLTDDAGVLFPRKYQELANLLLEEMESFLSPEEMDQIMERIGEQTAARVTFPDGVAFEDRLTTIVDFMDDEGYMASWFQRADDTYEIRVANCPYEKVARRHGEICTMDWTFLSRLLGPSLECVDESAHSEHHCTYVVHPPSD